MVKIITEYKRNCPNGWEVLFFNEIEVKENTVIEKLGDIKFQKL